MPTSNEPLTQVSLSATVNGQAVARTIAARRLLVDFLRSDLGLTGTHVGCDTTSCGACTVLLNDEPVKSCTMFAFQVDGGRVTTVEGISPAQGEGLNPLQAAFQRHHGLQCGYCTPGMLMAATGLFTKNPHPTESEVRAAIAGNICRCTGYQNIVDAILDVAGAEEGTVHGE